MPTATDTPKIRKNTGNAGKGRPKGAPNKVTREVGEYARTFSLEAIDGLVSLMRGAETEAVRKAAIDSLLDRGHGRPAQSLNVTSLTPEQLRALSAAELLALRQGGAK